MGDTPFLDAKKLQTDVVAQVVEGLARTSPLLPGQGFWNLTAGVNDRAAFGRAQAGVKLAPQVEAFGFGQVQKEFSRPGVGFEAGVGIQGRF